MKFKNLRIGRTDKRELENIDEVYDKDERDLIKDELRLNKIFKSNYFICFNFITTDILEVGALAEICLPESIFNKEFIEFVDKNSIKKLDDKKLDEVIRNE